MQVLRSNLRNNPSTLFGGDLSRHQRGQSDGCDGRTNDGKSKRKRKEPLRDKIPPTRDEIYNKGGVHVNNRTHRHVKKQGRCIEANEHDYVDNGGQNPMVVVEDDIIGLSPQVDIFKGSHAKVMPLISEYDERRCNCCSKPIDKPIWSGIFKIGSKEYISLAGHLSTRSGENVWKLSRSLMPVVELTKLPRVEVWPKRWEASRPSDDSIGLYFFHKMRPDEDLDHQLVKEVMENDLVLRAVNGEAEMLIFPSILLPQRSHMFQTKYCLWGVFKPREDKAVTDITLEFKAPKEAKQGDASCHSEHAIEDAAAAATTVPAEATGFAPSAGSIPTEATSIAAGGHGVPANHGQSDSSMGVPRAG